jgi:hypothetical protein
MSTSISNYYTRLITLTRSLPRDPLRPTLQLSDAIESAVHRAVGINRSINPSVRAAGVSDSSAGGSEVVGEVPLGTIDGIKLEAGGLKIMQEAVEGLEALKGDVAMKMVRMNRFSFFYNSSRLTLQSIRLSIHYQNGHWHHHLIRSTTPVSYKVSNYQLKGRVGAGSRGSSR